VPGTTVRRFHVESTFIGDGVGVGPRQEKAIEATGRCVYVYDSAHVFLYSKSVFLYTHEGWLVVRQDFTVCVRTNSGH
jgi:hypothetical protein